MSKSTPKNISQALDQLSQHAKPHLQEKLEAFQELLSDLKPHLEELKATAEEKMHQGYDQVKKTSKDIDEAVHEKPWIAVGLVAVVALILGFLMGNRRR